MIETTRIGPGTLTVGAAPLAIQQQCKSATLVPSENVQADNADAVEVLSGEILAPDDTGETVTFDYELRASLYQDLRESGIVAWSWENAGTEQPFTYVPNTGLGASFTGTLKPVPIQVGGDVGSKGEADVVWRIVGTPVPTWSADA